MTYGQIENGKVINAFEWDGNTDTWQPEEGMQVVELPEGAGIGWGYVNGEFTAPPPVEQEAAPVGVPYSVTMRQARLALLQAGKLADVNDAITALPSPQREAAQIDWDYAATVERNSPTVALMAGALGMDDTELDALFTAAAGL